MSENKKWKDISPNEQIKLSLSIVLIFASIILGFISFITLKEIPNSVLAQSGIWGSLALALLGISSYFSNELAKINTNVNNKINELNDVERKIKEYESERTKRDLETDT